MAANRVLIIDDDPDVRGFLQALLESEGYEVATAADGGEGLALQRKRPAQVVVTDIFMPGKEGIETIHQFHGEFPHAKIIVISGGPVKKGMDYLSVARELGAARSLKKPLVTQELIDAVRELSAPHS